MLDIYLYEFIIVRDVINDYTVSYAYYVWPFNE